MNGASGYAAEVKKNCGYELPVNVDEKLVTPFLVANRSLTSCDWAREAISKVCTDEDSKAAVKKSIKKVDCKLGAKKDAQFNLKSGVLTMEISPETSYPVDQLKSWLENNL